MTHSDREESRDEHRVATLRLAFAIVLIGGAFALRWFDGLLPDFQVWRAAGELAGQGLNPYDTDLLNQELQSDASYGPWWQDDPAAFRVRFFNPPMWLGLLYVGRFSPFAMASLGVLLLIGSIVFLSRSVDDRSFAGYVLVSALVLLSPLSSTSFEFGQSGILLAGLIGLRLATAKTEVGGVALALVSFKPHIALAAFLPALFDDPKVAFRRLLPPALLIVAVTLAVYGTSLVTWWVEAALTDDGSIRPIDDMTLRTLSQRWPLPAELSLLTLLASFVIIGALSQRLAGVDLNTLTLFAVALAVFMSGHGFVHDWLWIVFVPVVHRWNLVQSLIGVVAVLAVYSLTSNIETRPFAIISSPSVVALAVVIYLGSELVRQSRTTEASAASVEVSVT